MIKKDKIGIIGLGSLGEQLAMRLLEQNKTVLVFDIDKKKMRRLDSRGAVLIKDIRHTLHLCDLVFLSLPSPASVEQVTLDILTNEKHVNPKKFIVDLSTNSLSMTKKLFEVCKKRHLTFIDSPLTGGVLGAKTGTMTAMVGSQKRLFKIIEPSLKSFCKVIVNVGPSGHGTITKLLHNMIGEIEVYAFAEAFCFAKKMGIDLNNFYTVLSNGMATSRILTELYANGALSGNFNPQASVLTAEKDQKLLLELAESHKVKLTFTDIIFSKIQDLIGMGFSKRDVTTAIKLYEREYKVKIGVLNKLRS